MLKLTVTVMGEKVLMRSLSRFGEGIKDFRPVWKRVYTDFQDIETQQFSTRGSRGGAPWVALSPSYVKWKTKHYPGKPILELTGRLKGMMTDGTHAHITFEPRMLKITFIEPLPLWHQIGTGRMPPRPPIVLIESDKASWMKMLHEYVEQVARKAGMK